MALTPTMKRRVLSLQDELDRISDDGEVNVLELQRLMSDLIKETAVPSGLQTYRAARDQRLTSHNQPTGNIYA